MKTVHRFVKMTNDEVESFEMPKGAEIVHVQNLDAPRHGLEFWFTCDTHNRSQLRRFMINGTGYAVPLELERSATYVGTGGRAWSGLVWHLWEV